MTITKTQSDRLNELLECENRLKSQAKRKSNWEVAIRQATDDLLSSEIGRSLDLDSYSLTVRELGGGRAKVTSSGLNLHQQDFIADRVCFRFFCQNC